MASERRRVTGEADCERQHDHPGGDRNVPVPAQERGDDPHDPGRPRRLDGEYRGAGAENERDHRRRFAVGVWRPAPDRLHLGDCSYAGEVALDQSTVDGFREGAENVVKDAIDVAKKLQPTLEM